MQTLPHYLIDKLKILKIYTLDELKKFNYISIFQWLKYFYPSLSYKTLFDLYCLINKIQINSLSVTLKTTIINEYTNKLPSYPPLSQQIINLGLKYALKQAELGAKFNEVPIGAVIMYKNVIIASGFNQTLMHNDITKHAEIIAIQNAQSILKNHRLNECDIFVTIEPCIMCIGAIVNARLRRIIFGATAPKSGAICSHFNVLNNKHVNFQTEAIGPINNNKYQQLLQKFFSTKR